jgi:hypothetical protein
MVARHCPGSPPTYLRLALIPMTDVPDAYLAYIAQRRRAKRPKAWATVRQILIGVTLVLGYASWAAIPMVGGFIATPFFVVAGILSWRRDEAHERDALRNEQGGVRRTWDPF